MKNNKRIVICILLIVIMICTLLVISNKPKKTFNFNGNTIALLVNGEVSNNYYFSFYQAMLAGLAIMFTGSDNGVEMLIRALDME